MLQEEAMIVRLSISQWTARKFDKGVTQKVAREYSIDAEAGRYNKVLIAKSAIQNITKAVSAARTFHYENTLPWDDGGGRILPSANFITYSKEMRKLKQTFDTAVKEFISNYDDYRGEARVRLQGMFHASDYPGAQEIQRKFGFSTDIEPVPCANDFRVNVSDKDTERIKKELEKSIERRLKEATRDLYTRLGTVVKRFADTLDEPEAVFRNSLVDNIIELVELLPKLNVAKDPDLESLKNEVKQKLCKHDPDTLRKDEDVRAKAAEDAQAIFDRMGSYFKR